MSRYKGKDLFGSGAHGFHVHGAEVRLIEHTGPGVSGVGLTDAGRNGRRIDQTGSLLGDDAASITRQLEAIEAELGDGGGGGGAGELVDDLGRVWSNVVLVRFEPGAIERVGVRLRVRYAARYVCVGG